MIDNQPTQYYSSSHNLTSRALAVHTILTTRLSLVHNHPYVLRGLCGQNSPHFVAFRTVNVRTSHDILARRGARRWLQRIKSQSRKYLG